MTSDVRIDQYLDGELPEEDLAQFEQWLQEPAHLQQFVRRAELHADLRKLLCRQDLQQRAQQHLDWPTVREGDGGCVTPTVPAGTAQKATAGRAAAALLATAGVLCVLLMTLRQAARYPALPALASVESAIDAELYRGTVRWHRSVLSAGTYELKQGLLHLRFAGGVMVYVEAPAVFAADSRQQVVLQSGRLSAQVPPAGVGFTVETPDAQVVDFGTEFSVDVAPGASEVHVFDGLVRVQPKHAVKSAAAVDVRRSQAVKVEAASETADDIPLAPDRFIRNFDEPKVNYRRAVLRLDPVAYYPMPIRDRGLIAQPPQYSGVVLTGTGKRPPHARGVFTGGSLRVLAESSGRGGRIDVPPPLRSGQMTLTAFVYCESRSGAGILATNQQADAGSFSAGVDAAGQLTARIQAADGTTFVAADTPLPLQQWRHVVMTVERGRLCLYEDGRLTAEAVCGQTLTESGGPLWLGTDAQGGQLWNGRIDELAIFDRRLSEADIALLYQTAKVNQRELESQ
ncbi:MAG: FecR domain-containing protein [Planctomycetaceae bacterium]|nr:FecR domain-containing protein [Planctomycetaceae bacterium]